MFKKLFTLLIFAVSFTACDKESLTGTEEVRATSETAKTTGAVSALAFTSCPALNPTVNYLLAGNGSKNMSSNTALRAVFGGSFNTSKKISFQIAGNSTNILARIVGKSNGNPAIYYAMSSCTNVPPGGLILTSATNVPSGTAEVHLEFFTNSATYVAWTKIPQ